MAFCQNCGIQLQDGVSACPNCGTFVNGAPNGGMNNAYNGYNVYNGMGNFNGMPVIINPKIPGRGLGISGMVLGIIGLVYSFLVFLAMVDVAQETLLRVESAIPGIILYSSLSILGVSLAGAGRKKGYRNGISTAGVITGVIGLALWFISIIICAAA